MQLEDDSKDRLLFLWAQATVSASHSEEAATVPGGGRSLRPSVRGTWHSGEGRVLQQLARILVVL